MRNIGGPGSPVPNDRNRPKAHHDQREKHDEGRIGWKLQQLSPGCRPRQNRQDAGYHPDIPDGACENRKQRAAERHIAEAREQPDRRRRYRRRSPTHKHNSSEKWDRPGRNSTTQRLGTSTRRSAYRFAKSSIDKKTRRQRARRRPIRKRSGPGSGSIDRRSRDPFRPIAESARDSCSEMAVSFITSAFIASPLFEPLEKAPVLDWVALVDRLPGERLEDLPARPDAA